MWLVLKTERRWQPRAGAAMRCRNTSDRRKRRVNYEKISLLIVCLFAKFPRQRRVNYTSCMSFCKDSTPSTYQWLCYRASRSSITINVLVVLRQVVGLTQFIVFRYIFVWKGFLLLMSWEPSAFLDFPVETSTASFSRCSGMLLAGSEIGKSEGMSIWSGLQQLHDIIVEKKLVLIIKMIISSLRNCWHAYCSAMAYILIENFNRYEWRRAKAGWENLFLSAWLSVPCTFRKISPA